jgi:DNA gyrase/topoisomerase IV subunit A
MAMRKGTVFGILLGIACAVSLLAAANFYVGLNEERTKRVWTEQQLARVTQAKEALEQERDELLQTKQSLETKLADLDRQAKALADQLAQEKRAREALTIELAQVRKEANQAKSQLEAERQEKAKLNEDLTKATQSYQALSNELTTLRQAKEALEKRLREMLAARAKEAEQIVVRPEGLEAQSPPKAPPLAGSPSSPPLPKTPAPAPAQTPVQTPVPPKATAVAVRPMVPNPKAVEGKVLVVNREFNFVVVNLGSKDGLKTGSRLAVFQQGRQIGTVEVERLYDNMSAANVVAEEKKGQVQEGDTVRLL